MKWNRTSSTRVSLRLMALLLGLQALPFESATAAEANPPAAANRLRAMNKAVASLDKPLVTRLNSAANPGDRDTWYVIVVADNAAGRRRSVNGPTTTLEMQAARIGDAAVVQGRRNAAIAVFNFYSSPNRAASILAPRIPGRTLGAELGGTKTWDYIPFKNEADAQALLEKIKPSNRE